VLSQAQIAEYESLREEAMRNMDARGNLTNAMAAALAALFGLSGWFRTADTFQIFFFVPALAAMWGYFIYHAYDVHLALQKYLLTLENRLGLGWTKTNPPKPALWGYSIVLLSIIAASIYFINMLQNHYILSLDLSALCELPLLLRSPSIPRIGWLFWYVGVALSGLVGVKFLHLYYRFSKLGKEIDRFREETARAASHA
jgi:hypothetical protein